MARQFSSGWSLYNSAFNGTVTQLPVTVSAWFRPDNTSGYQRVTMWSNSGAGDVCASILLNYPSAGQLSNQFYGPNYLPTAAGTFTTSAWNHGCVVTGSTAARSYLNGSVGSDSPTYVAASYAFTNNSYFQIGMNYVQGVQGFAGRIAEVAAWSAELTAGEVAALAAGHSPLTIRPGSLLAYYPLGGHYGERDIDVWKSKFDLSVYGSPTWADHCRIVYPSVSVPLKTATPLNNYLLTAAQGSCSLTGQSANLNYGRTIAASQGSFTLNGQDVGLVSARKITSDFGSYIYYGDIGIALAVGDDELAVGDNLLAVGQTDSTNFIYGRGVTAERGDFTLTGQAAGLLATRTITAAQGSYSLTGQDAGLLATRQITAAQGSYTLSGQVANLLKSTIITADVGSFTVNGQAASLNRGYAMEAGSGSYALNGQDAGLTRTYVVACDYGSYAVNGQDAGLLASRVLTSDSGTYSLTGQDAGLFAGRNLAAAVGEFDLTGQSVSLVVAVPIRTRCVSLSAAASYSTTVVAYSRNASITAAASYSAVGEIDQC